MRFHGALGQRRSLDPMRNSNTIQSYVYLLASLFLFSLARAAEPQLVIVDNDFNGPPNTLSNLRAALMFLESSEVKVLGFTVVTGDGWRDEEVAHTLKLLEIAGFKDIPVVPGAVLPLVNSQEETEAWEMLYGSVGYKGAFNSRMAPDKIPLLPEGMPAGRPADSFAPIFMIQQVHAHPHEVSIFAGGPLTNLAITLRLDPEFPKLVKELVFMGALVNLQPPDFNIRFDPEAAHIVLTAPWPSITSVGEVTSSPNTKAQAILSEEVVKKLRATNSPIAKYVLEYSQVDLDDNNNFPLWDELAAAVLIDPLVITKSEDIYLDVDIDHNMDYGRVHAWWDDQHVPHTNKCKVRVVDAIDVSRFKAMFIKCMSAYPASP
jgi:inosine-uridine nucleoside N-ribohydrolase